MKQFVRAGSIVTVILGFMSPAVAQADKFHITPKEYAACDDDVVKLCSDAYPDEDKLLACMKSRHDQLSPMCLASFRVRLRKRHIAM